LCAQRVPCSTAKLRCPEGKKHFRTTTAAEVSPIEAYLDPRVHYPARGRVSSRCDIATSRQKNLDGGHAAQCSRRNGGIIKLGRVQLAREQDTVLDFVHDRLQAGAPSGPNLTGTGPCRSPAKLKELLQPHCTAIGGGLMRWRLEIAAEVQATRRNLRCGEESPESRLQTLPYFIITVWRLPPSAFSPLSSPAVVRSISELPGLATTLEATLSWDYNVPT